MKNETLDSKKPILIALGETIDFLIQIAPLLLVFLWLGNAIYTVVAIDIFSRSSVWIIFKTINIHAITMLSLTTFYLYTFYNLDYLLPHVRVPVAMGFAVLGLLYYDFIWIIFDYVTTGYGMPFIQFALFFGAFIILWFYDVKYRFFKLESHFYVWQVVLLLSMGLLALTGFYQTLHANIDPHPNNWIWALGKFTGIWAWSGTYMKRGGLEK